MLAGFFSFEDADEARSNQEAGFNRRLHLPIAKLLARIRKLIPRRADRHYDEIVRGFGNGALRPSAAPMSDRELSQAIADFLKDSPSTESVGNLNRRIDPSSPL
jgi:hypothetical protein